MGNEKETGREKVEKQLQGLRDIDASGYIIFLYFITITQDLICELCYTVTLSFRTVYISHSIEIVSVVGKAFIDTGYNRV